MDFKANGDLTFLLDGTLIMAGDTSEEMSADRQVLGTTRTCKHRIAARGTAAEVTV